MPNIPGIEEIKSIKVSRSRSVPPNANERYLNLFMLSKEKERLEKERIRLDTRREWIVGRLKEIEKELGRLQGEDKEAQQKRDFDWDAKWVKVKKEVNPEEPKKPKIETGWKIKILKKKRQNL